MWGGLPVPAAYEHLVEQQQLERRFFSGSMPKAPPPLPPPPYCRVDRIRVLASPARTARTAPTYDAHKGRGEGCVGGVRGEK